MILSDEETEAILFSAEECAASECSVDDVSKLLADLKMQEGVLSGRLVKIMNMIAHLQHVNEKKERKTDEVRAFVKDMLRVFSHEVRNNDWDFALPHCEKAYSTLRYLFATQSPNVFPTGWAGDVGDGPTTAYDALEPKKWKPSEKKWTNRLLICCCLGHEANKSHK